MSESQQPSQAAWGSTYNMVKIGRARYQLPIKSVIPLVPGYKFWIPIRRSILVDDSFVRPMWKPRNSPNYMRVEVVRVKGDLLVLQKVQPPFKPRVVKNSELA